MTSSSDARRGVNWPAAIVFDLDGTLVHAAPDIHAALNRMLASHDLGQLDLDAVTLMIGAGPAKLVERALRALGETPDEARVLALTDDYTPMLAGQGQSLCRLYDGVEDTLRALSAQGIKLGLCTNKPEAIARQLLVHYGIDELFGAIVGFDAARPRKPDAAPLLATLDALGVGIENALYVGDSITDVQTGHNASVPVIAVSYGYSKTPARERGADGVIDRFAALPDAIKSLNDTPA
jgi:phosphoglycolate phosphatase